MKWDRFGDFLLRVRTIHAAGDKWADRGGSARPPSTVHRPPSTVHRPPTTDHRPAAQPCRFKAG
jgi:hypothetical protein